MKISFPKYGPGEPLIKKRAVLCIISLVIIGVLAGLCGIYLLEHKFSLLTIAVLGIASILVCLGGAAGIFLNSSKVHQARTALIKENVPRITSQWDYRPKKPIRAAAIFDRPSAETSEVLSPDSFGINNNVWFKGDSLEGVAPTFINPQPDGGELMTKALSETTDTVCAAPTVDDVAVSRYD